MTPILRVTRIGERLAGKPVTEILTDSSERRTPD